MIVVILNIVKDPMKGISNIELKNSPHPLLRREGSFFIWAEAPSFV